MYIIIGQIIHEFLEKGMLNKAKGITVIKKQLLLRTLAARLRIDLINVERYQEYQGYHGISCYKKKYDICVIALIGNLG